MSDQNNKRKNRRMNPVVVIGIIMILAAAAGVFLWMNHINKLRTEMNDKVESAIEYTERGLYRTAHSEAEEALALAQRLRDDTAAEISETILLAAETVLNGNTLFDSGDYNAALEAYLFASDTAKTIGDLNTEHIDRKIAITEMYIAFFALIEQAEAIVGTADYETALLVYEEAKQVAAALAFAEGINIAGSGIEEVQNLIIQLKRTEAENFYSQGDAFFNNGLYDLALEHFNEALEIFTELDDYQNIFVTRMRILHTEEKIAEAEMHEPDDTDETPGETPGETPDDTQDVTGGQDDVLSNYEHNLRLDFDLRTLLDDQNRRPANQIRMGTTEGMNEGWYNGCGWVATYNALILLGNPRHPAEIVRHFEESGGTVMGGVFGTYPNTIEAYLRGLGYNVNHTLFPQLTLNLDDEIKNSRISILAYAHTSAAHYVTIEYVEDIDKFIVYNDSFARSRSAALGLSNTAAAGAVIDSVAALINNTREILFSFSLIVVS